MKSEMGMEIFSSCSGLTQRIVEKVQKGAKSEGIADGGFAIIYENTRNDKRLFGDILPDEKMIRTFPFVKGEDFNDFEIGCYSTAEGDEDLEGPENANFEIYKVYINDELCGEISVVFITEDEISEGMTDEIMKAMMAEVGSCCKVQH
jgi:hypothetical protein